MLITKFDNESDWLDARRAKITGTKLKDIIVKRGTGRKIGFYQLLADRLAIEDDENPMERGHRLEVEAIDELTKQTGVTFNTDLVIITRTDNSNIAWSPDGYKEDLTQAVEVKCLKSAIHLQALIEQKIPSDYEEQCIQAFIVDDKLDTLYFVFYDPRVISKPFHYIEVKRSEVQDEVELYKVYEEQVLKEIDELVEKLAW